jgi:hypothetical protein
MIVHTVVELRSGKTFPQEYGHNIGSMGLESLDQYLHGDGVKPLSAFMDEDRETLEAALDVAPVPDQIALARRLKELRTQPEWHDPQEGLATVNALQASLPREERYQGVVDDLAAYAAILEQAARDGDAFRLTAITSE